MPPPSCLFLRKVRTQHHAAISISAGQRGRQVVLSPDDLISLIGAKTADLTAK